jgi:hypothetical protein
MDLPTDRRGPAYSFARQKYEAVLRERGVDIECSADRLKIETIMLKLRTTVAQFESSGKLKVVQKSWVWFWGSGQKMKRS